MGIGESCTTYECSRTSGRDGAYRTAVTPKGNVTFCYRQQEKEDGTKGWDYELTLPDGVNGELIAEDGAVLSLKEGENRYVL